MAINEESNGPEGPPSHHEELARWSHEAGPQYGRKLTFSEKCGIAWALHRRMKKAHPTIGRAFNLSRATVSQLNQALDPNAKRYRDVYEEYYRLGPELFADRYYTRELHMRLKRVMLELTHLSEGQDIVPRQTGSDLRAAKYRGPHTLEDGSQWIIDVVRDRWPEGWGFKSANSDQWRGAESVIGAVDWRPFTHSADAFDAIHEINGYESPRAKPGRPRK